MNVSRYSIILVAIGLTACAKPTVQEMGSIQLHTAPAGGRILIEPSNQWVNDGEVAALKPGHYHLRAEKHGYRGGEADLDLHDGKNDALTVPLGQGFGTLTIQAQPAGALVRINGESVGKVPLDKELNTGEYHVTISASGFVPHQVDFTMEAGDAKAFDIRLTKVIDSAPVTIVTHPTGGRVAFGGRVYAKTPAALGRLHFGRYHASASKQLDPLTRLVGRVDFSLSEGAARRVVIPLKEKQRLFEGKWLPYAQAMAQESKRYRRQRVSNPVHVIMHVAPEQLAALAENNHLAADMMVILRTGDRVSFVSDSRRWLIWKRHNDITPAFAANIEAVQHDRDQPYAWADDSATQVDLSGGTLADLAYALHRARSKYALLDLRKAQLSDHTKVFRANADGAITVLAIGGDGLSVADVSAHHVGRIHLFALPAGASPVSIGWQGRPERLLVISDTPWRTDVDMPQVNLRKNEKQAFRLVASGRHVSGLIRLSAGPDYEGWKRQVLAASGPMADQFDFTVDEIGPHKLAGRYQRVWIVRYAAGGAVSQRQVATQYTVGAHSKQVESDRFFRRKSGSINTVE